MARRIVHMNLSVTGALMNWRPRDYRNVFQHPDGRYMDGREAKRALLEELAKGHLCIPIGGPCEGFDYGGGGCPGHDAADGPDAGGAGVDGDATGCARGDRS